MFFDTENELTRRGFLSHGMWGALLAYASLRGLKLAAGEGTALAADAPIAPEKLAYNPHWWKIVFAFSMLFNEVPFLEFVREGEPRDTRDATFFHYVRKLGERVNWGSRVVPVRRAIHPKTEILPYQEFEELLMRSEVTGVGTCWCRSTFKNCDAPRDTCIHLGMPGNRLDLMHRGEVSKVSRDEIRDVIRRAEEHGLVHELIRAGDEDTYYVICNCCTCCCASLRGLVQFGNKLAIASEFAPEVNSNCTGCGVCVKRCPFGARAIVNRRAVVDATKCLGCGLCATGCPNEATFLVKRTDMPPDGA
jgi:ferredoxin